MPAEATTKISRDFLISGRDLDDFSPLEEDIVEVMRTIYDPEIPVPIWDLGLIYGWDIQPAASSDGNNVTIRMTLTAPNCPAAETLPAEVEQGINALVEIDHATLDLVFTPTYSMEMMSEEARLTLGFM